jgi:hypothetical protein
MKGIRRVCSSRGAVFLEYTLLFALVALVVCAPLIPGGPLYDFLRQELLLRIYLIALPLF